jgi:transcriptional regulator with XRE-family HTH domain
VQDPKQQQWLLEPGGIAAQLRKLQGQTPGVDFARASGLAPSKISKLRRGQQLPKEDDIRSWVAAAGADPSVAEELIRKLGEAEEHHSSFERKLQAGQEQHQRDYNELVQQAGMVKMLERSFIPRLLQTFGYARAVMVGSRNLHHAADDVDAATNARLECQVYLTDGKHRFEFVIDETVLTRNIATHAIMQEQMDRLLESLYLPGVRIGILPVYGDYHDVVRNSFELYGDVGMVETYHVDKAMETEQWIKSDQAMTDIWQDAVEGEAARSLIIGARDHHAARA